MAPAAADTSSFAADTLLAMRASIRQRHAACSAPRCFSAISTLFFAAALIAAADDFFILRCRRAA